MIVTVADMVWDGLPQQMLFNAFCIAIGLLATAGFVVDPAVKRLSAGWCDDYLAQVLIGQ